MAKKSVFFNPSRKCEPAVEESNQLTFFSASIHLLMAGVEDPVRSFMARTASLMTARVAIVGIGDGYVFAFFDSIEVWSWKIGFLVPVLVD